MSSFYRQHIDSSVDLLDCQQERILSIFYVFNANINFFLVFIVEIFFGFFGYSPPGMEPIVIINPPISYNIIHFWVFQNAA
jgi:hypothetical protein